MSVTAFKRKLKSKAQLAEESAKRADLVRQRNQERQAMRLAEAKEAEWHGVSVFLLRRIRQGPLLLPLAAYYTQDEEREAARAKFYAACARVFRFEGWNFDREQATRFEEGFGEHGRDVRPISKGSAVNLNVASAPLEWLAAHSKLATFADGDGINGVRLQTGLSFRDAVAGAATTGLKGQAYEGGSVGSGAGRQPSDHAIDCMNLVRDIKDSMHPGLYRLMEWMVCEDRWVWESRHKHADRDAIILKLHKALDHAAVTLGLLTKGQFRKRWNRSPSIRKLDFYKRPAKPGPQAHRNPI